MAGGKSTTLTVGQIIAGIEDVDTDAPLIYFDPITYQIIVDSQDSVCTIDIYSIDGRKIKSIRNIINDTISLVDIAEGVYVINATFGNGQMYVKKIIR